MLNENYLYPQEATSFREKLERCAKFVGGAVLFLGAPASVYFAYKGYESPNEAAITGTILAVGGILTMKEA